MGIRTVSYTHLDVYKRQEDIKVIKQGLKIPNNAKNYKEFSKMMKESENEFLKNLI